MFVLRAFWFTLRILFASSSTISRYSRQVHRAFKQERLSHLRQRLRNAQRVRMRLSIAMAVFNDGCTMAAPTHLYRTARAHHFEIYNRMGKPERYWANRAIYHDEWAIAERYRERAEPAAVPEALVSESGTGEMMHILPNAVTLPEQPMLTCSVEFYTEIRLMLIDLEFYALCSRWRNELTSSEREHCYNVPCSLMDEIIVAVRTSVECPQREEVRNRNGEVVAVAFFGEARYGGGRFTALQLNSLASRNEEAKRAWYEKRTPTVPLCRPEAPALPPEPDNSRPVRRKRSFDLR